MATLHGPRKVSDQLQVKIPVELARALRLRGGDLVHFRRSDADPDVLLLIPDEVVERRYQAGEDLEASHRSGAEPLQRQGGDKDDQLAADQGG